MSGIISYGAYVPYNRLKRSELAATFSKSTMPGEKAVANYDEDSITMAVAASINCCKNVGYDGVDGVYFATTTAPYKEKTCATVISTALDLRADVRTADFSSSLRCGVSAIQAAADAAAGGKNILVAAADCRPSAADGKNEELFGDGAAAFLIGNENVVAEINATYSVSADFHDVWRSEGDGTTYSWDERFAITQQYNKMVTAAVKGVMEKAGVAPADVAKAVIYAHTARYSAAIAKTLGFGPNQVQDPLHMEIGNTGAASAPMMLVAALETAKPGDKILLAGYGEGCDAILFTVTELIDQWAERPGIRKLIDNKRNTMNYVKYLRWKRAIVTEPARRPRQLRPSLPEYYRNKKNLQLYGSRCTECGTPQYPPAHICPKCFAVDKQEPYRFFGRKATIATFTMDYLAESLDPPNVDIVVDFEGGGRMFCNLVDCDMDKVHIGMEVEMVFRCLFEADGIHNYFWKASAKLDEEV